MEKRTFYLDLKEVEALDNSMKTAEANLRRGVGTFPSKESKVLAIDFDGTCVTHKFPEVGKDIGAAPVLRELVERGHKLILWTVRSNHEEMPTSDDPSIVLDKGMYLDDAVQWFKDNNIPLFGIQSNPEQYSWSASPKAYAHYYIDDAAIGCPLVTGQGKPYVDWTKMKEELVKLGLL